MITMLVMAGLLVTVPRPVPPLTAVTVNPPDGLPQAILENGDTPELLTAAIR
jgi:hypothetical protein